MLHFRKGFTLVELLVVMGILLVLVTIAVPAVNSARNRARDTEVKAGCNEIQRALEQHAVDNSGFYPGVHYVEFGGRRFSGPGVIGGLPSYDGTSPRKDFTVAKNSADPGGPNNQPAYLANGVPNPAVTDVLITNGYLTDYPANPFLRSNSGSKSQMSNLFLIDPAVGVGSLTGNFPVPANRTNIDWNRYTATGQSFRAVYPDYGRGHFTYVPLNPVNNEGVNYNAGTWPGLTDAQRSQFYRRCRGYMLIGWGNSRQEDSNAKGISEKYWNSTLNGFDFDSSQTIDLLEGYMSDTTAAGILRNEQQDSAGSVGAFGGTLPGGARDIDPAFNGAVFVKITGS